MLHLFQGFSRDSESEPLDGASVGGDSAQTTASRGNLDSFQILVAAENHTKILDDSSKRPITNFALTRRMHQFKRNHGIAGGSRFVIIPFYIISNPHEDFSR